MLIQYDQSTTMNYHFTCADACIHNRSSGFPISICSNDCNTDLSYLVNWTSTKI